MGTPQSALSTAHTSQNGESPLVTPSQLLLFQIVSQPQLHVLLAKLPSATPAAKFPFPS